VPSVRKLSAQLSVSVSTVLQAYRILEDRGRIEARPQSGYYVRPPLAPAAAVPRVSRPSSVPTKVTVGSLIMEMLKLSTQPGVAPLGGAIPPDQCLPTKQLNRIQAAIARRTSRGSNFYDLPPGCKELRVQVARRYIDAGCALSPDELITTCGCTEALNLCLRAVARPGDVIALESPAYYGHLQIIEALGMRALEIPTCPQDGVSLDALRFALDDKPVRACLFVTNFQNPTGAVMPDETKRELVELLAARDVPLIEDDIYGDLGFDLRGRPKVCKAYDAGGNVLLCGSFSKTLAPGARVGWCAPPPRWRDALEELKVTTTMATPSLPQLAIAEFLASGGYDHHLRKVRRYYAQQVQLVSAAVQRAFPEGTRVTRPAGGHVLWVEMPPRVDALDLHARALERKINIAPGPIFSAKGKFRNFIRLNCALRYDEMIERALITLGRLAGDA